MPHAPRTPHHAPELERELLRRGVVALALSRHGCADCGRTPLIGERVYVYDGAGAVCALCRSRQGGEPLRSEPVLGSEHGHAVRMMPVRRAA